MTWTSKELAASTCHGTLTLGGVSMNNKAWASLNNFVLWNSANRRGSNTVIPEVPGVYAHPRRKTETSRTLECLVIGDCNTAGAPHANRSAGLATNWLTLKNGLLSWTGSTVTASLLLPNGSTISGPVQIVDSELGSTDAEGALTFTLDINLVNGELS